jgi:hypothetical protein
LLKVSVGKIRIPRGLWSSDADIDASTRREGILQGSRAKFLQKSDSEILGI